MGLFFGDDPLRDKRDEFARLCGEFEGLRVADSERLSRYSDYRRENESARDDDLVTYSTGETDYGRRRDSDADAIRHRFSLPFGVALTVKHAYRVAGRMPDAVVPRREESPQERYRSDTMEKIFWSIVCASGEDTLFAEGAWYGSQLGAACYDVYFDPAKQMPYFRAVDPAGVIVVRGVENPHDFERVYRFWDAPVESVRSQYRDFDFDGTGALSSPVSDLQSTHKVGNVPMVTLVQCSDRERTVRFSLGENAGKCVPLYEREHGLGFAPYVVIPNIGPYSDVWGWADYEFVRSLVAYIPALLGREADVLRMVANGAYIEKGTGQQPEAVDRVLQHGGTLPSKRDGDVKPIEPPQMPTFADAHRESIMELFKMLGFAPDASWGGSDTRSGQDRALQLQPLLELTAMKQTNWSRSLTRLAWMAYRMIELKQINATTFRGVRPGLLSSQRKPFAPVKLGPGLEPMTQAADTLDGEDIVLPRSPKELFDGDYAIRFVWQNRIDPDDPAYVLSELNKFAQGTQSLRTTLERLGFQAPEDEIKLIEEEAQRHPWLREGMIALLQMQMQGGNQGEGGGAPSDPLGGLMNALGQTQSQPSGNTGANAGAAALPGGLGKLYGA